MKTYFLFFILMTFTGSVFSQKAPEFKLTKDGIKPVVIEFDSSYSAGYIYSKVKEWIALNNRYPKSVTRIDEENSLVKFSCYTKDGFKMYINDIPYWYELKYTIMVEIKDYKCRITFDSDEDRYKFWYNDDGTLKERFKDSAATFENTVNKTLTSLYNHIAGLGETKTDDW